MPSKFRSASRSRISFFSFQDIVTSVTGILVLVTLILTFHLDSSSTTAASKPAEAAAPGDIDLPRATGVVQASNTAIAKVLAAVADARSREKLERTLGKLREQRQALSNRVGSIPVMQASLARLWETNRALGTNLAALQAALDREQEALEKERAQTNRTFVLKGQMPTNKKPILAVVSGTSLRIQRQHGEARNGARMLAGSDLAAEFRAALATCRADADFVVFLVKPSGIRLYAECVEIAKAANFEVGYEPVPETM